MPQPVNQLRRISRALVQEVKLQQDEVAQEGVNFGAIAGRPFTFRKQRFDVGLSEIADEKILKIHDCVLRDAAGTESEKRTRFPDLMC